MGGGCLCGMLVSLWDMIEEDQGQLSHAPLHVKQYTSRTKNREQRNNITITQILTQYKHARTQRTHLPLLNLPNANRPRPNSSIVSVTRKWALFWHRANCLLLRHDSCGFVHMFMCLCVYMFMCLCVYVFERGKISVWWLVICYTSDVIRYDWRTPELAV